MTNRGVGQVAAVAAAILALLSSAVPGADLYWSGTGTWDTTTANWGNASGTYTGSTWTNSPPDSAIFEGTAGTVTLNEAITAAGLTFSTTGYTVTGDTLTLSGTPTIAAGTGISATIASFVAGSDGLGKTGAGTVTLSAANTYSGGTTVSGGTIVLGTNTSLGDGTVTLNGGAIERNAIATVANSINVATNGGTIVARQTVDDYTTLSGQLTGSGPLTIDGLVDLSGTSGTYSGTITLADSGTYLRFSSTTALATTASLSSTNGGFIKLLGNTLQLASVSSNAQVSVDLNTTGRLQVGSGTMSGQLLNDQGQLVIEKVGAGTLALSRAGGNGQGIGGVTVTGGTLQLAATGLAFNGNGYFGSGQSISVGSSSTLQVTQEFNTNRSSISLDGGTLNIASGNANDSSNYITNLTLSNGANVTGNAPRFGFLANGVITVAGTLASTISTPVTLVNDPAVGYTVTFDVGDVASGTDLTVTGGLRDIGSGNAGAQVIKSGPGTMQLNARGFYSGATTVSAGTLVLAAPGEFGNNIGAVGSGTLTIAAGASVESTVNEFAISGLNNASNARVVNNAGTLTLSSSEYVNTYNLTGGTLNGPTESGRFIRAPESGLVINSLASATSSTVTGRVDFTFANGTMNVEDGAAAIDLDISSTISQNTGAASPTNRSLTKTGAGTLRLSSRNTYAGGTTVSAGTLVLSGEGDFNINDCSVGSGALTIASGATVQSTTFFTISGLSTASNTRVVNNSGTLTLAGSEYVQTYNLIGGTLNGPAVGNDFIRAPESGLAINSLASATSSVVTGQVDFTFASGEMEVADGAAAVDLDISATISQNTGAGSGNRTLTKTGPGTLRLSGVNSYAGGTIINGGALVAANNSALGSGTATLGVGGTLRVDPGITISNTLSFAGGGLERVSTAALGTVADIVAGEAVTPVSLAPTLTWSERIAGTTFSDVLDLTNTSGTIQILQLTYDPSILGGTPATDLLLGWENNGSWVNAIAGNTGPVGGSALTNQTGSFTSLNILPTADFLGSWGRDTTANTVWAVVNHNSDFAAIAVPEPGTLGLAAVCLAGGIWYLCVRRDTKWP